ncbi:Kelch repeat-containing protein [Flavihumibacter sp.]|uniref:Kelch repeat-containing protein n=1 Tax=Flavihumibacter sp. TaxID=1913981 RepID=UPI002FCAE021
MKPILKWATGFLLVVLLFNACKKEYSCEGCLTFGEPPIADAGIDMSITLPKDSVLLDGSASADPDGSITEYKWSKVAGPPSSFITNFSSAQTMTTGLEQGVYQFELVVTDDEGFLDKDTVQVTVLSSTNQPPVANAGADQTIVLPVNSIELDGSASSDPDNNISSYTWINISGPGSNTIVSNSSVKTEVKELIAGTYLFEIRVTDAEGLFSLDTMQVIVSATVGISNCDISDRPLVYTKMSFEKELSSLRSRFTVAYANNKLVIAGGINPDGSLSSRVDIWDLSSNTWTTAELSEARYDMASAVLENKIFFAGGFNELHHITSDRVDIYDVVTNSWSTSTLGQKGAFKVGAAAGNKVLFAGGLGEGTGVGSESIHVDIYNVTTNTWSATTLAGRSNSAGLGITATVIRDNIYLAGATGDWFAWDFGGEYSSTINIYNTVTDSWSVSHLREERGAMGGIAIGNINYWAGGREISFNQENIPSDIFEVRDMQSSVSTYHCLFQPNNQPGVAQQGSRIIIFTSTPWHYTHIHPSMVTDKFDIYDISTNSWFIGLLPMNIYDASIISINNNLYVIGGIVDGSRSYTIWKLELQ